VSRIQDISARLTELSNLFRANLAAASGDYTQLVSDEAGLSGMSDADMRRAAALAREAGQAGFLLTLGRSQYEAARESLDDRGLRKSLYEAYFTRASDHGPRAKRFDNTHVVDELLELRTELAVASGYRNFAAYALRGSVISDPDLTERYLTKNHKQLRENAQADLDQLWAFAKEKGVPRGFAQWDLAYYAAGFAREELRLEEPLRRGNWSLDAALAAAARLAERLLGVRVERVTSSERELWHVSLPSQTGGGELVLEFFGEADYLWQAPLDWNIERGAPELRVRTALGLDTPEPNASCRLRHAELDRVFRAVGAGLQLLTSAQAASAAELPHAASLASEVAGAYFAQFTGDFSVMHTCAEVTEAGFEQILASRVLHQWLRASQLLELQLFDLRIHRDYVPAVKAGQVRGQVIDTLMHVCRQHSVLPPSYWTRPACIATPIFADGFAARLWERSWVERVAAELYRAFGTSAPGPDAVAQLNRHLFAPSASGAAERVTALLGRSGLE